MQLYKVLVNGKSCHGGDYQWPMPSGNKPGKWTPEIDNAEICKRGYHLTSEPYNWFKLGCDIFEAEGKDLRGEESSPHKSCFASARLIRKTPKPDWMIECEAFVASIPSFHFCKPDGNPIPEWKLFTGDSLAAARAAAWAAARDAAGDARLKSCVIVSWLKNEHSIHAEKRMEVWRKGFCLLCDVNGVLYVYATK